MDEAMVIHGILKGKVFYLLRRPDPEDSNTDVGDPKQELALHTSFSGDTFDTLQYMLCSSSS